MTVNSIYQGKKTCRFSKNFMLFVKEGDAYGKIDLNERIAINF
jgi:hypothetical protein